jgi:glucose/arabinose dehydrogenase
MKLIKAFFASAIVLLLAFFVSSSAEKNNKSRLQRDNGGITLPDGFSATVVADTLGMARHLVVNSNGDIYVKLERRKKGLSILRLRDANNDGVAESITGFGNYGGTGIAIKNGYLYASSDEKVFRYKINNNEVDTNSAQLIVTALINKRQHSSKSIALDNAGNIYVNIGAPSNSCQEKDRTIGSMGKNPCPILDSAGGVWMFKADKLNQSYADGIRYVTGIRNIVGLDWNNEENELYAVQHGRDDLNRLFPDLYNVDESVEQPAEEMFLMKRGSDFGWPYCYYDWKQKKKFVNPEYGGDKKKTDRCDGKDKPIYAFPGHWGPNALLFYTGKKFPEKYRNGAFIAWHGSWNRAPRDQEGYFVTFLPFKNGKPSGDYEIFADGFAGATKTPQGAMWRPCGLAQGPDGSIYVSDDQKGRIWKINYNGR